jgi:hypothetical protein
MTLSLNTNANTTPQQLLAAFKKAIDEKRIVTWSYDKDGDFTHTPTQWHHKAWMRPQTDSGVLNFKIIKPTGGTISWEVYGVYHGRMAESFIVHCHDKFSSVSATSHPSSSDIV